MKKPSSIALSLLFTLLFLGSIALPLHADSEQDGPYGDNSSQTQSRDEAPEADSVWGAMKYTGYHIKKGSVKTGHVIKDGSVKAGKTMGKGFKKAGSSIKKFFVGD